MRRFRARDTSADKERERERERERENTQKVRGNCIHVRRIGLLQLDVWLQGRNIARSFETDSPASDLRNFKDTFHWASFSYSIRVTNIQLTKI